MTAENPTAHEAITEGDLPEWLHVCPSCHLAWWPEKPKSMSPSVRLGDEGPVCADCERTMVPFQYLPPAKPARVPVLKRICEGPKAHKYNVKPVSEDGQGTGWYSSDKDFCPKCGAPARAR